MSLEELSYPKANRQLEWRTSVESSILCSHEGRVLVVKGTKEVENAETNSKYQDKAKGQRPGNFIRSKFDTSEKLNRSG
ncbi:hypothetical protein BHM03_00039791 [Ensete ventricosum]|nr:hypothetical protein BHM03_00039791 [Ensete ventricosum]